MREAGKKGGAARAVALTAAQRSSIAAKAARARWRGTALERAEQALADAAREYAAALRRAKRLRSTMRRRRAAHK